jgi:hypothetical protein
LSAVTVGSKFSSGSPMPIITTLVIWRSPFGPAFDALGAAQFELGHPQLADDLGHGQVAVEALLAGRAEAAVDGAAGLRAEMHSVPRFLFRDEHGFDRIAVADVDQPFAGAVGGRVVADDGRRRDVARVLSFSRSDLARSVMSSKLATPNWWIQRCSCLARNGFSPNSAQ